MIFRVRFFPKHRPEEYESMVFEDSQQRRWLKGALEGDAESLTQLLQGNRDFLLLLARTELDSDLAVKASGSDVVQESLLEAQQSLHAFQGTTHEQWQHWLQAILSNNIKDLKRRYLNVEKRNIQKEVVGVVDDDQLDPAAGRPSGIAVRNEQVLQLEAHIQNLPAHYQRALRLRFWEQLSYDRMAAEMETSPEAVRKILYRAVEELVDAFRADSV